MRTSNFTWSIGGFVVPQLAMVDWVSRIGCFLIKLCWESACGGMGWNIIHHGGR